MIDLKQFGNTLVADVDKCQASIIYKQDSIWHKLYIKPNTNNATKDIYTTSQILEKVSTLDIFKDVILDYSVIDNDKGVYVKLKHLDNKIKSFSEEHISMYDNFECFTLDYFQKHFHHTIQSAPLRFNDFTCDNIFIQDDLTWRNVDIADYFDTRYFPKIEFFVDRTWAGFSSLFDDNKHLDNAKEVFLEFYNQKRLNTVEQHYKQITKNW